MGIRLEIVVTGEVQGVGYRDAAMRLGRELGLAGWVANSSDGSVKIVAEGLDSDLKTFLAWCYNGSENSRVEKVEATWLEAKNNLSFFHIEG